MSISGRTVASTALARLPEVRFAFAYGSAVKPQASTHLRHPKHDRLPLVDLGLVVSDASRWHEKNLELNPDHYSFLKKLGHRAVCRLQRNSGAGVYFNTLVPLPECRALFKYGVVSEADLLRDLLEWRYLYFAGRLHKPVSIVVEPQNSSLEIALRRNLLSAIGCALLVLPEQFNQYQLYRAISYLSYSGDFRMIFGENKNKVDNIVEAQLNEFAFLYLPMLADMDKFVHRVNSDLFIQDMSAKAKLHHLVNLPLVPKRIVMKHSKGFSERDEIEALTNVAENAKSDKIVSKAIRQIVWQSSVSQSIKGMFTAGFYKTIVYSARKINKMFQ